MLEELTCSCEGCERPLDSGQCQMIVQTRGGERRAYECGCGTVTVTVVRP